MAGHVQGRRARHGADPQAAVRSGRQLHDLANRRRWPRTLTGTARSPGADPGNPQGWQRPQEGRSAHRVVHVLADTQARVEAWRALPVMLRGSRWWRVWLPTSVVPAVPQTPPARAAGRRSLRATVQAVA